MGSKHEKHVNTIFLKEMKVNGITSPLSSFAVNQGGVFRLNRTVTINLIFVFPKVESLEELLEWVQFLVAIFKVIYSFSL